MVYFLTITIMSGVEDGSLYQFNSDDHGKINERKWQISIGRLEENDLVLRNDSFISREHAFLALRGGQWWLKDRDSTNGTFIEIAEDFFNDRRVRAAVLVETGQLFRIGRTWLRIEQEV